VCAAVASVPRAQAARWLLERMHEGFSIDPKLFAGLYFLDHAAELFGPG
jgi:ADP-ribose pyrophosphatase